jgi:hypothetical protein
MLRFLAPLLVFSGLVLVGAAATIAITPPAPRDCYTVAGRDGVERGVRLFILNKCDGTVRVLVMPDSPPPPASAPNYSKPNI